LIHLTCTIGDINYKEYNKKQKSKMVRTVHSQGCIQDFKLGGAHLKKLRRAEGGANIFGVFRVKNHDFTPKNHIFLPYYFREHT
jgi:hypothetical protein